MMKKILGIVVCTLVLATCLPVTGTNVDEKKQNGGITPFWNKEHTISIFINKIWVFESSDSGSNEPGEYFFIVFVFPLFKHVKTGIYEVDDEHPQTSYSFGKIAEFMTKLTPVTIVILAIEDDKGEGIANTNEFMDYTTIRFKPPRGDYPPGSPYSEPPITWKAGKYFEAQISISFHYW